MPAGRPTICTREICDEFEKLLEQRGEVYMGNRGADFLAEKVAIRRRVAELEREGKLDAYKNEQELAAQIAVMNNEYGVRKTLSDAEREETIRQAKQELVLKSRLREIELDDLNRQRNQQVQEEDLARTQELEQIQVSHQNEIAMGILLARQQRDLTEADFLREQKRLQNRHALEEEWERSEQRRREERANAVQQYDLIVQRSRVELEAARHRTEQRKVELQAVQAEKELEQQDKRVNREVQLEALERMTRIETEQMQAVKRLELEGKKLELDYKRFEKEQDTRVQLASIEGNVTIASAQANTHTAVASAILEERKGQIDELRRDKDLLRDDANRRAEDLTRMAESLSRNLSGAGGAPAAGGSHEHRGAGPSSEFPCPKCQRPVPLQANFCPWCQHDMRVSGQ